MKIKITKIFNGEHIRNNGGAHLDGWIENDDI